MRLLDDRYAIPLYESPSTHILKPESAHFLRLVDNEAYCLKVAAAMGLNSCEAKPVQFGEHRCLLVARYDRIVTDGAIHRLHQEDFCQALAVPSRLKYQNEGGPGLVECFDLIRSASSSPARDLFQLFNGVLFNYLIGNHDAHGKNFSLLYSALGEPLSVHLAPFYDLISTACYPELTTRMAMKIGKTYDSAELRLRDWELYWEAIVFSANQAKKQMRLFTDSVLAACGLPDNDSEARIQQVIKQRSTALLKLMR